MQQIKLTDEVFALAQEAAHSQGFETVEGYLAARIEEEALWHKGQIPESFFTAEVLAAIDEGIDDADAGRLHTVDEVREHFKKKSQEWRDRAS